MSCPAVRWQRGGVRSAPYVIPSAATPGTHVDVAKVVATSALPLRS